jgi:hypothetical protein
VRDRAEVVLARHFFTSLFNVGFLTDTGVESLKRVLLGILAISLALGLLLARVFMEKYERLSAGDYALEIVADHAFLMAVPMWCTATAVALVSHSLFLDRTDFRILMAEPLSRLTVFTAKLAALLLFVGLLVTGTHLALLPLTVVTLVDAVKTGSGVAAATAFAVSSVSGSLVAALAVVAIQGSLVVALPAARLLTFSGVVRSALIGILMLTLPLIQRLPATAMAFASDAWWLRWTPPAWFVGLERRLMGDGRYGMLAVEAILATVLVVILSVSSYVLLYRRFDRVMLQGASFPSSSRWSRSLEEWVGWPPVRHATRRFVSITIRRSFLHQGLVVGVLTAAGGYVLNGLLNANWSEPLVTRGRSSLILTLLWAPIAMMCLAIPGIRLALSVPLDVRSNWVFRMTQDVASRAEVASANIRTVLVLAVLLPLALTGPVQWWTFGSAAAGILTLEALIGWLVVEWVMAAWNRIPFTCSYIPGKGSMHRMALKGFAFFMVFTFVTTFVLLGALANPLVVVVVAVTVGSAAYALSRHRKRHAPHTPLVFDDELPTEINPLSMNAD